MNIFEFKGIKKDGQLTGMDKLEAAFRPLTDEQRDIYFDRLRLLAPESFYKAIDYVIDVHKDKIFPRVAEILEATSQASETPFIGLPEATGIKCSECRDTGYILADHEDKQPSTHLCECELGKKIKQGWIDRFNRGKK